MRLAWPLKFVKPPGQKPDCVPTWTMSSCASGQERGQAVDLADGDAVRATAGHDRRRAGVRRLDQHVVGAGAGRDADVLEAGVEEVGGGVSARDRDPVVQRAVRQRRPDVGREVARDLAAVEPLGLVPERLLQRAGRELRARRARVLGGDPLVPDVVEDVALLAAPVQARRLVLDLDERAVGVDAGQRQRAAVDGPAGLADDAVDADLDDRRPARARGTCRRR